jgi:hypothetical protein
VGGRRIVQLAEQESDTAAETLISGRIRRPGPGTWFLPAVWLAAAAPPGRAAGPGLGAVIVRGRPPVCCMPHRVSPASRYLATRLPPGKPEIPRPRRPGRVRR